MSDDDLYQDRPDGQINPKEVVLEAIRIGLSREYGEDMYGNVNFQTFLRRDAQRLVVKIDRTVWAERLLRDIQPVPYETTAWVAVHIPGPRVWYAPWRRRPFTTERLEVAVSGMVNVAVTHFAAYPDFVPPRPEAGRPVRYSTIEQLDR